MLVHEKITQKQDNSSHILDLTVVRFFLNLIALIFTAVAHPGPQRRSAALHKKSAERRHIRP
jgi:hypothetical protein